MPLNNDMAMATISKHAQFIRSDFFRVHRTQGRRTRTLANIKDVSSTLNFLLEINSKKTPKKRKNRREREKKKKKSLLCLPQPKRICMLLN